MADERPQNLEAARRVGSRVGIVVFALIVTSITVAWSTQIVLQVWAPAPRSPATAVDATACRENLLDLVAAVERARRAAAAQHGGERAALARFREQLEPEWLGRTEAAKACAANPRALVALRQIDDLRYAEEHAVRYEAVDLAHRRRRVQQLKAQFAVAP